MKRKEKKKKIKNGKDFLSPRSKRSGTLPSPPSHVFPVNSKSVSVNHSSPSNSLMEVLLGLLHLTSSLQSTSVPVFSIGLQI